MVMIQQLQEQVAALAKSEAQATREKLYYESESQRMRGLLEVMTGPELDGASFVDDSLFAIAA
jgi:hypothetical protein